jgi:hypothetical protein
VSEGLTLREIAKELGCSRGWLCTQVTADRDLAERLKHAREIAAHGMAEDALDVADAATPLDVNVRRLQMDARKWLAAKWSPKAYGERQEPAGGAMTVNVAHLHLQALRSLHGVPAPITAPAPDEPVIEGELVAPVCPHEVSDSNICNGHCLRPEDLL